MANRESTRTAALYNRRPDGTGPDDVELPLQIVERSRSFFIKPQQNIKPTK